MRQIDWVWFNKNLVYYYSTYSCCVKMDLPPHVPPLRHLSFYLNQSVQMYFQFLFNRYSFCSTTNSCQTSNTSICCNSSIHWNSPLYPLISLPQCCAFETKYFTLYQIQTFKCIRIYRMSRVLSYKINQYTILNYNLLIRYQKLHISILSHIL